MLSGNFNLRIEFPLSYMISACWSSGAARPRAPKGPGAPPDGRENGELKFVARLQFFLQQLGRFRDIRKPLLRSA